MTEININNTLDEDDYDDNDDDDDDDDETSESATEQKQPQPKQMRLQQTMRQEDDEEDEEEEKQREDGQQRKPTAQVIMKGMTNKDDVGGYGEDGDDDNSESTRQRVSPIIQRALLQAIEKIGGEREAVILKYVCNANKDLFGVPGSLLRRSIQDYWRNSKRRTIKSYSQLLDDLDVPHGAATSRLLRLEEENQKQSLEEPQEESMDHSVNTSTQHEQEEEQAEEQSNDMLILQQIQQVEELKMMRLKRKLLQLDYCQKKNQVGFDLLDKRQKLIERGVSLEVIDQVLPVNANNANTNIDDDEGETTDEDQKEEETTEQPVPEHIDSTD